MYRELDLALFDHACNLEVTSAMAHGMPWQREHRIKFDLALDDDPRNHDSRWELEYHFFEEVNPEFKKDETFVRFLVDGVCLKILDIQDTDEIEAFSKFRKEAKKIKKNRTESYQRHLMSEMDTAFERIEEFKEEEE